VTEHRGKAAHYARYRSDYTPEAVAALVRHTGLTTACTVADLGSGTGILTRHLLAHAREVFAVEPAEDMRAIAEESIRDPRFHSVAGTGEATTLGDQSIDVITCGNSFHYFDPERAREEAKRILRESGRIALLFHDAPPEPEGFTRDYLAFLRSMTPKRLESTHATASHEERMERFFGRAVMRESGMQSESLGWDEVLGRYLSSSMASGKTASLRQLFEPRGVRTPRPHIFTPAEHCCLDGSSSRTRTSAPRPALSSTRRRTALFALRWSAFRAFAPAEHCCLDGSSSRTRTSAPRPALSSTRRRTALFALRWSAFRASAAVLRQLFERHQVNQRVTLDLTWTVAY